MKGVTATATELKARWAYSELTSTRFASLYSGIGTPQLHVRASRGDPFSALPQADWQDLVGMLNAARGAAFANNVDNSMLYICEGWDRQQLMSILALPAFNPPLKQKAIPYSQFYNGTPNTGSGMKPEPADPRVTLASLTPTAVYAQDEPAIVINVQGQLVLLEGYLRSLLFMRSPDPNAEFLVWVPQLPRTSVSDVESA